jgi:hypothetical protein
MFGVFGPSFVDIFFSDIQSDQNTIERLQALQELA